MGTLEKRGLEKRDRGKSDQGRKTKRKEIRNKLSLFRQAGRREQKTREGNRGGKGVAQGDGRRVVEGRTSPL